LADTDSEASGVVPSATDEAELATPRIQIEELPGPSHFPTAAVPDQFAAIGDAVHGYLAALPSIRGLDGDAKRAVATRCLAAFAVTGVFSPNVLVSAGDRFSKWVESTYPGARWHTEVPLTAPRTAGGQWRGAADLLLQLPRGSIVVIDHKSAPIRQSQCAAKAATFTHQLAAYREAIETTGERVTAMHIHFPLAGVIAT
jgi:ATP-dependent exoDNAse (exonuclease V) beta subunit